MRAFSIFLLLGTILLISCSGEDPMKEIRRLESEGNIVDAKKLFTDLVEAEQDPNLEKQYIRFLFEHNQLNDFRREHKEFLAKYPDDLDIKALSYEYYAKLVNDAEKNQNYETAYDTLVSHLLSPDFKDFRKWESRQITILKKWFQSAQTQEDTAQMRYIMVQMKNHKFDNLAKSLDEDLYNSVASPAPSEN